MCAALASSVVVVGSAPASADCESIWVEAYEVELEIGRKVYRIGETARVEGTVTRADTGAPVAGADFVAILPFKKSMVIDVERTDSSGHAVAKLRLKRKYVRPGPARLWAVAYDKVADTTCAEVLEYGEKRLRKACVIRP